MPLDTTVDRGEITELERKLFPAVVFAEREAVARGAASTRKLQQAFIRSGGEGRWEQTAPLTELTRLRSPTTRPTLSQFSKLIAFEVSQGTLATGASAVVGHTPFKSKRGTGLNLKNIAHGYRGHKRPITWVDQHLFAFRAYRKARGESRAAKSKSGRLSRSTISKYKSLSESEKLRAKEILKFTPRRGTVVTTPEREMPDTVLDVHGEEIARKMGETFTKRFAEKMR